MKIGVLGSGNGACATAGEWALNGHDVYMFDFEQFDTNIKAIHENKGIKVQGKVEGFGKIKYAGHNIEEVVSGADIIFAVGPAYSTQPFGEACKGHIEAGQVVIVMPSSCAGSIVFKNALGLSIDDNSIIISETSTLPYASRVLEPGQVQIYNKLKGGYYIATLPREKNGEVYKKIEQVYGEIELGKNVFKTSLQNANPVIHPAVSLLNVGNIERDEDFFFYEQGVTPAVGRLIKAVDQERIKIGEALGVEVLNDAKVGVIQGYMQDESYEYGYAEAEGFKGILAQTNIEYRYFTEDVAYGLIFMIDLAKKLNVKTPVMESIVNIVSVLLERDFFAEEKRTLKTLGLTLEQINEIVE